MAQLKSGTTIGGNTAYHTGNLSVTSSDIANNAVTDAKIASGAVTDAKIASGAVTNAKIASGAVTNAKIASGAVTNAKIANATIGTEKFQTGSTERNWVLARTAGASAGAVGTYAWLGVTSSTSINFNSTSAGSGLRPACITAPSSWANSNPSNPGQYTKPRGQNSARAGTWRLMGTMATGSEYTHGASLWLRIS